MTALPEGAAPLDLPHIRTRVDTVLADFLRAKTRSAAARAWPEEITTTLHGFLSAGGKRLRPTLCVVGWHAGGGGSPAPASVLRVAAALEMFHAFALIHDDIMDHSLTRRGQPTAHRALAAFHQGRGDADQLGVHSAILLGDLALVWSDELLHAADLTPTQLAATLDIVDLMRTELVYGQYLDLCATGHPTDDVERCRKIVRYKTVRYTLRHPLAIGATLADAEPAVHAALDAYAHPVGEAFQLADDLLGVYGHPDETGKSRLDDLRDGKHTLLTALALRHASPAERHTLRTLLGAPGLTDADADRVRAILDATGAPTRVADRIRACRRQAEHLLDQAPFPPPATTTLRHIAHLCTVRTA
ncbi:polyprenyl synthetase family protein [Streptomyces sp. JJ66]|uniref:polyprenyl synthetase family protein n=1 Tax=Streptomyces sp. JJ66 TaxID=2803843 RepID=UPI001C5A10CB|nr:polyprenyl synthetase family protein [Streptomyces sp. JJ66]MBW1604317.1 polyprenyl synthetase family protein [Streptomyces sp. JJ66]